MPTTRRQWLQQAALSASAFSLPSSLLAFEESKKPGDRIILLNSNENAFGPSKLVAKAMADAAAMSNRYPDDQVPALKEKLANFWKVGKENVLMGAGSSEILGLACLLVSNEKGHVISAEPSYKVWHRQAENYGLQIHTVPLTEKRQLNLPNMISLIAKDTRMLYVCNPNNPTGLALEYEFMRQQVLEASKKCMVLVDEAYTEFANIPSMASDAANNPNIIVAKTFSKIYGLAGARVGYAISHPDTIKKLAAFQPWPDVAVSMVTAAAASAAIDDQAFVKSCRERTAANRDYCGKCFSSLGLEYLPSQTSFMLFDISGIKGDFSEQMKARNIFVQYRDHFNGKWCRVSMGTEEEMKAFCTALKSIATT